MTVTILDSIPFTIDGGEVLSQLQFPVAGLEEEVEPLLQAARAIARPKAMYREAFVEARAGRHVVIDGVRLTSRILSVNLERIDRVFPFVVTCGAELEAWSETITDPFLRYWADAIKELALSAAYRALDAHLAERYGLDHLATMNPGSLADWPIEQQQLLVRSVGRPPASHRSAFDGELLDGAHQVGLRHPFPARGRLCQLRPLSAGGLSQPARAVRAGVV
jgi:hypothetical protein